MILLANSPNKSLTSLSLEKHRDSDKGEKNKTRHLSPVEKKEHTWRAAQTKGTKEGNQ